MNLPTTPSQTVGPFFAFGLSWPDGPHVVPVDTPEAFWIRGRVLDGAGDPVTDALVETWQADPHGRLSGTGDPFDDDAVEPPDDDTAEPVVAWDGFRGFGRCATDPDGWFGVLTMKPGRVPHPGGALQAPHLAVTVLARGLLQRVVTRIYFADERDANDADPVLRALPDDARRATLLATLADDGYGFDIHLQGEDETVFFAV